MGGTNKHIRRMANIKRYVLLKCVRYEQQEDCLQNTFFI